MNAVMLSVHPESCNLILSGIKTIDVRKSVPKTERSFICYIYKTKEKRGKLKDAINDMYDCGKVIGEFVCNEVRTFHYGDMSYPTPAYDGDESFCECGNGYWITCGEVSETCLTYEEIEKYGKKKTLYGWRISDLKIYDKPKELDTFFYPECKDDSRCDTCSSCVFLGYPYGDECATDGYRRITRPPQSWCYVLPFWEKLRNDERRMV